MKKFLLAGAALAATVSFASAADLPARPIYKAPPAPVAFSWTGCYVGGHLGYGWAKEHWNYGYYAGTDYNVDHGSHTTSGVLGGAQAGCNYQTGPWVFGAEGDFSWTGMEGSHHYNGGNPFTGDYLHTTKLDWIATITGRIGYAFDRSLLYVKGGVAWDHGKYQMFYAPNPAFSYSDAQTRTGWIVGAGWEYAFDRNWSVKLEYNYIDMGKKDVWWNYLNSTPPDPWSYHVSQKINVVKTGFNYRF